jgi:hypothetical protein
MFSKNHLNIKIIFNDEIDLPIYIYMCVCVCVCVCDQMAKYFQNMTKYDK